jgi:hypothetical protein
LIPTILWLWLFFFEKWFKFCFKKW